MLYFARAALACLLVCLVATPAAATWIGYSDYDTFVAVTSSLTTEDFEENPPWGPQGTVSQPFTNLGVTWTSADTLGTTTFRSRSGEQGISDLDNTTDPPDQIFASLPEDITAVGVWINTTFQRHNVTLSAYDSTDSLIGFVTLPDDLADEFRFIGLTTATEIARIDLLSDGTSSSNDDFVIDDFSFGVVVPEPSTFLLVVAGLVSLGIRRTS